MPSATAPDRRLIYGLIGAILVATAILLLAAVRVRSAPLGLAISMVAMIGAGFLAEAGLLRRVGRHFERRRHAVQQARQRLGEQAFGGTDGRRLNLAFVLVYMPIGGLGEALAYLREPLDPSAHPWGAATALMAAFAVAAVAQTTRAAASVVVVSRAGLFVRGSGVGTIPWPDIRRARVAQRSGRDYVCVFLQPDVIYSQRWNWLARYAARRRRRRGLGEIGFRTTPENAARIVALIDARLRERPRAA